MLTSDFDNKMADSRNIEHISGVFHVRQQKNQFGIDSREEVIHEDTNAERIRGNYGNSEERSTSYFAILYSLLIYAVSFASIATQTLIPLHDNFLNPEYWWEMVISNAFVYMLLRIVLTTGIETYSIFQIEQIMTIKWHFKLYVTQSMLYIIIFCSTHFIWTLGFNNVPPMPMANMIAGFLGWYLTVYVMWAKLFPLEKRNDPEFRKRLNNYVCYLVLWSLIPFQVMAMDIIYYTLTSMNLQWAMALVIPLFRSVVEWMLPKFFNKAVGYRKGWTKLEENEPATFCLETQIAQAYSIYIAIKLSSFSPYTLTSASILGVEFLINLYHCFQIIRTNKKIGETNDNEQYSLLLKAEKKSAIVSLVTVEFIETSVPLLYAIGIIAAYYGPNASLMIGIKNEYFGFPPIADLQNVLIVLLMMAAIDAIGGILIGILLGFFCKINLFKELCEILQKYWIHLSLFMGGEIMNVSSDINYK